MSASCAGCFSGFDRGWRARADRRRLAITIRLGVPGRHDAESPTSRRIHSDSLMRGWSRMLLESRCAWHASRHRDSRRVRIRRGQLRGDDAAPGADRLMPALAAAPAALPTLSGGRRRSSGPHWGISHIKTRDDGYLVLLEVLRAELVPDAAEQAMLDNEEKKLRERATPGREADDAELTPAARRGADVGQHRRRARQDRERLQAAR